jgi:glycosyltransferase involved in cell wall biosynthesis
MSDTHGGHAEDRVSSLPPRLSVVIPCYNSAATIGDQLTALAAQRTRYSWEVLIADNGSRDDTVAVVKRFRDRIPALRIVDSARGGVREKCRRARSMRSRASLL